MDDDERQLQNDISAIEANDPGSPGRLDPGRPAKIAPGMAVLAPDGSRVGTVAAEEPGRIRLAETGDDGGALYVPSSLVDGVGEAGVILSGRGDATFGEGATP